MRNIEFFRFITVDFISCLIYFSCFAQTQGQITSNDGRDDTLQNGETYILAAVDDSGQLHIKTSSSRDIFIQKDSAQTEFDDIRISDDGQKVGWLAMYDNVATSYPIPLELNIYSGGRIHKFTGIGLPIWQWEFTADGKQIAYEQETVHGGWGIHYELRVIDTEQLIELYEPVYGPYNQPLPVQKNVPEWVEELNNKK
ncbi:MAG TPA: hypothetical protein VKD08_12095 [Ignavibacteriaceae bacterium]|nr:hypothetical protein [Ignavibacteriaceae bacterium]